MASKKHQFLLGLLIKKVRLVGYQIYFLEGKFIEKDPLPIPPKILRHRPDALGVSVCGRICICDAKTFLDTSSDRTKEQLIDFSNIELNGSLCEVFIAIPASAEDRLNTVLRDIELIKRNNINILKVPDEIING
jgi:hypothetical protein